MKKLLILSFAVCAMMMASCGNKTQSAVANSDSDTAMVDTSVAAAAATEGLSEELKTTVLNLTNQLTKDFKAGDSKNIIVGLANLETIYRNLAASGKLEDAKVYGTAIKNFITSNAETIKNIAAGNTTIASLVNSITNLPTAAETTAEQAKAAVVSDVVNLASPAIAKGETAVATAEAVVDALKSAPTAVKNAAENAATSAVKNAEAAATDAANSAVNEVQNKAAEKVNKAADEANKKVNEAAEKANKKVNDAANKALKGLGL